MKVQAPEPETRSYQTTRRADRHSVGESPASAAHIDHRSKSVTQRTLQALQASRRVVAQGHLLATIDASPRQVFQRRQFRRLFGKHEPAAGAVEPMALHSQRPVQRAAEFRWDQKVLNAFSPNAVIFLNQALERQQLMAYIPPDLRHGQGIHPALITPIVRGLFESARNYGTFDLGSDSHLQRLTGIIVQTHRAGKPKVGDALAGDQPAVAKVGRNEFRVIEKTKGEILEILALWNAYYQYKIAQYDAIRGVSSAFYDQFSRLDSFKNFANVGPMIGMVLSAVRRRDQKEIHDEVRVAINPTAQDKIAAILVYSSRPTGTDDHPGYVADLLANPKSIKPDRKESTYKEHKRGVADPSVKGQGRVVLPDASDQRGAANSLLQHAVLESGPEGIQLYPFDDTTKSIYLGMDFGGAKFEEQLDQHLLLKPKDMAKFEAHAQGSLKQAIADWRARYA